MDFVHFPKGEQKKFLQEIKMKSGKTWDQLVSEIGKTRAMIFFYLREESKIPVEAFQKLSPYSKKKWSYEIVQLSNTPRDCLLPAEMSPELAELLGALAGDGHLGKKKYQVSITVSRIVDTDYAEHVKKLFYKLFSLKVGHIDQDNRRKIRVYSKKIHEYLVTHFKLPVGKKKNRLHIPIFSEPAFMRAYIRGLFDTDGSFYERGRGRGVVNISSADGQFLIEVQNLLRSLSYHAGVSGKNLTIYSLQEIKHFFENIQPANVKHQKRFQQFIERRARR